MTKMLGFFVGRSTQTKQSKKLKLIEFRSREFCAIY